MSGKTQLNKQQLDAVTHLDGPLLIIAGAGSGKTRVITHRIAALLESGVPGNKILALTFTNKAAKEMDIRARELAGKMSERFTISTFHSFGVRLLREWIHLLGFARDFSIYDQTDQMSLLKQIVREIDAKEQVDLYGCAQAVSAAKTGRGEWPDISGFSQIYEVYNEHMKAYNAVDFDDLIMRPLELFSNHAGVVETLRHRHEYVLVDEFQDTSQPQYRIVRELARNHRNLCVVGDDDQSIYSWRGANYENIGEFERDFPESREIKLERNYRSTKQILNAANSVISNNRNRKGKALWTGLEAERCIELYLPRDEYDEGRFIARAIRSTQAKQRVTPGQMGILVRTNAIMAPIEEALLSENIAYKVSGGTSFFQRKEIKDVVAYLRVMANPDDNVSLLRIINTPRRGIGRKSVQRLRDIATERSESLYSTIRRIASATSDKTSFEDHLTEFSDLIETFRNRFFAAQKRRGEMSQTLDRLVEEVSFWGQIIADNPDSEKLARFKYRSIQRLIEILGRFEKDPDTIDPTLFDFLSRISLITREDTEDENGKPATQLMTIHAAKGLEFEVVFLAGAEDALMPHSRAIDDDPSNIEEERRLFYVALTRAKNKLVVTSCMTRTVMRQISQRVPSRFLEEIPQELIHHHEGDAPVESDDAGSFFDQIRERLG